MQLRCVCPTGLTTSHRQNEGGCGSEVVNNNVHSTFLLRFVHRVSNYVACSGDVSLVQTRPHAGLHQRYTVTELSQASRVWNCSIPIRNRWQFMPIAHDRFMWTFCRVNSALISTPAHVLHDQRGSARPNRCLQPSGRHRLNHWQIYRFVCRRLPIRVRISLRNRRTVTEPPLGIRCQWLLGRSIGHFHQRSQFDFLTPP